MNYGLHYNLSLPSGVQTLMEHDLFLMENVRPYMFASVVEPIKFDRLTWIFVRRGECVADISLHRYEIKAPAMVLIESSQIMQIVSVSEDFDATVIAMTKRFQDQMFLALSQTALLSSILTQRVVTIPQDVEPMLASFFENLKQIQADASNQNMPYALLYELLAFIYRYLYRCYENSEVEKITASGRISNQFLQLLQSNFRTHRFLDYYSQSLGVTAKHLSRTVKAQTGCSAAEWIERFVTLEAKVLLRSSNLTIQQISDELNFASQSFFGKYFKSQTGYSPKEFRKL